MPDISKTSIHIYIEQGVWIFGDWDKALRAAGFDPEKMRERGVWDEEKITEKIGAMHQRHLPLYAKYVMDNHYKVFKAALRQFASWPKALVASWRNQEATHKKAL